MDDPGVRIKDFALDPAQDLTVFLEHRPPTGPDATSSTSSPDAAAGADIRVHLRRLSAGTVAPHPAAGNPVLCRKAASAVHGCMIQIVEDIVGMYFCMPLDDRRGTRRASHFFFLILTVFTPSQLT